MANVFPQQFGPYTLHQLVGRGGMAEIYRATMPGIGSFEKVLAIKKILPHLVENEEYITMLTDEARLVVGLNHANIAQVYDLGRISESYYIAMEYIHGVDIALIIKDAQKNNRHIPYEHVAYMMSGLCMGLHVAHHATGRDGEPLNIIHRDISPHNVLISFAGDVKVIDFGVAKASSKEGQTQVGVIKGKLLYMAPEQAMAKDIDGRADLFAAGLVMYKMLTWELPFQGDNEFQIYNNILTKEIVPPKVLNPQIPDELNHICMTLLQRDVNLRYQDGYAAKRELERTLHHIAPGYTPSRLSRFIEENFLEQVQERLRRQNATPEQLAAREAANSRVKEPVHAQVAQPQPAWPPLSQTSAPVMAPEPSHVPQRTAPIDFGATPVPSDPSPMTPNGFHTPTHQTPSAGFTPAPQEVMRTQNSSNLSTGHFPPMAPAAVLPAPPGAKNKRRVPAILFAVILLGLLFLGMGAYVFLYAPTADPDPTPRAITATQVEPIEEKPVEIITPPEKEEPPPVVEPVTHVLTTTPPGAQVFQNDERQGIAPLNIELRQDNYPVKVKVTMEGYEDQELEIVEGSGAALHIDLVKLVEETKKKDDKKPKDTPTDPTPPRKNPDTSKDTGIPGIKKTDDRAPRKDPVDIFGNKKDDKTTKKKDDKKPVVNKLPEKNDDKKDDKKELDKVLGGWE